MPQDKLERAMGSIFSVPSKGRSANGAFLGLRMREGAITRAADKVKAGVGRVVPIRRETAGERRAKAQQSRKSHLLSVRRQRERNVSKVARIAQRTEQAQALAGLEEARARRREAHLRGRPTVGRTPRSSMGIRRRIATSYLRLW